jgi:hypothetical protein
LSDLGTFVRLLVEAARIVEGQHQPLISRELFDACQQLIAQDAHPAKGKTWEKSGTVQFYLKGVLKDEAGRNMTAYKSRGKSGRYFHYYGAQRRGQIIPAEQAHHIVALALAGLRIDGEHYLIIKSEINTQLSMRSAEAAKQADAARRAIERANQRLANVRADYADGNIQAREYREMRTTFEADLIAAQNTLIASESAQAENDGLFYRVLDLLSGIDTVFAASSPEYRNKILRAVFPEGFSIDAKEKKVRTPCVNQIISELCSKSITSQHLEEKRGMTEAGNPSLGAQQDRYRTHQQALRQLFAA